jgi:acyl-[acyl-carrier-protein] desaturase
MAAWLTELEPTVTALLDRHLAASKEWFPHDVVPWDEGAAVDPAAPWDPETCPVSDAVRSALFVNLLTEDNLPHYFATLSRVFGNDGPWGAWTRRWTAEEGRHSIAIRDYITVRRLLDPRALERARMHQVSSGVVPQPTDPLDGIVYVALQELATRIAHRATGRLLDDRAGYEVMARVATDENHHFLFYRDLVSAALELDATATVQAIERQVLDFEMPGTGITGFEEHARSIARAGIYDLQIHHDQILVPVVLRHWDVAALEGLDEQGEAARGRLIRRIERIGRAGNHLAERWARDREAVAASA